jgi:molybdopterin-guanine dinucleotide biosynthesis protein B
MDIAFTERRAGRRLLMGFDFPMGYPRGFAARLTGEATARAVWRWLAERLGDGPDNANNRFALADQINARLAGGGTGPFWGRPAGLDLPHLPARREVDYDALGLPERRQAEQAVPRAQPVWKLYTTGSVGSQSLTGLPVIHRLSHLPGAVVWPFDPMAEAELVLAEIYPSLLSAAVRQQETMSTIRDEVQVRLLSQALLHLAQRGDLHRLFAAAPEGPPRLEEGWILGAGPGEETGMLQGAVPRGPGSSVASRASIGTRRPSFTGRLLAANSVRSWGQNRRP